MSFASLVRSVPCRHVFDYAEHVTGSQCDAAQTATMKNASGPGGWDLIMRVERVTTHTGARLTPIVALEFGGSGARDPSSRAATHCWR